VHRDLCRIFVDPSGFTSINLRYLITRNKYNIMILAPNDVIQRRPSLRCLLITRVDSGIDPRDCPSHATPWYNARLLSLIILDFTIRSKLYSQIPVAFRRRRGGKVWERHTYNGYNGVRFYWYSGTSGASTFHTCPHTCMHVSRFSGFFPYVRRAFVFTRDAYHVTRHLPRMVSL